MRDPTGMIPGEDVMGSTVKSTRYIGFGTLAVLALVAAILAWSVIGSDAKAGTEVIKLHGATAFGFTGATGDDLTMSASNNGVGKNKTTTVNYDDLAGNFGFGNIPNADFSGDAESASLDTHSDSIDILGGGVVFGVPVAITGEWSANGIFSETTNGNRTFQSGAITQRDSGHRSLNSADFSGTIGARSGTGSGDVGSQRINRTISGP